MDEGVIYESSVFDAISIMAFGGASGYFIWLAVHDIIGSRDPTMVCLETFVAFTVTTYFLFLAFHVFYKLYDKYARNLPSKRKIAPETPPEAEANDQEAPPPPPPPPIDRA